MKLVYNFEKSKGNVTCTGLKFQLVENDRVRNGNREALTALRRRARTTKSSVPSPFESIMKEMGGSESRPLVKEICTSCGNHDSNERTWMMFPGTDLFARVPFHAAHSILETGYCWDISFDAVCLCYLLVHGSLRNNPLDLVIRYAVSCSFTFY